MEPNTHGSYGRFFVMIATSAVASERAQIEDLPVRELADAIIAAQRREIREMEWLIDDIRQDGAATTEAEARAVPDF